VLRWLLTERGSALHLFVTPAGIDGAYIGTTFAHLFFMTFGDLVPTAAPVPYVPRIFGYRIHRSAPGVGGASAAAAQQLQHAEQEKNELLELREEVTALRLRLAQREVSLGAGLGAVAADRT
jgi:hypothetical protein